MSTGGRKRRQRGRCRSAGGFDGTMGRQWAPLYIAHTPTSPSSLVFLLQCDQWFALRCEVLLSFAKQEEDGTRKTNDLFKNEKQTPRTTHCVFHKQPAVS